VPIEIGLLARMRLGERGDRHAGVVDTHDPFEGLEIGVEELRRVTCVTRQISAMVGLSP
jgi:hypothetical protein